MIEVSYPAEGVARILQDTGPHNFSTFAANERLLAAIDEVEARGVRVVVLGSSVPGTFIGHGWLPDLLETFTGGTPSGDPLAGWRSFTRIDGLSVISIAAVDGEAWGHGAELAWTCDLRVASEGATFGQPEVFAGTIPGSGGTVRLSRLVGESVAKALVLDGRPIDAATAHRVGLVHRVVPAGQALAAAVEWASDLASRPAGVLAAAKRAINGARELPYRDALRHEGGIFVERLGTPEVVARLRAIQERYDTGAATAEAFEDPPAG